MVGSVVPVAPARADALVHRKSLIGFRLACEHMWGPAGFASICRSLPPDVADRTAGLRPLLEWVPLGDLIAWHVAVWNGPAKRDEGIFTQHIQTTVDLGFGRVKRLVLGMSTPQMLAPRVVALWSDEYSTGRLDARFSGHGSVELKLTDHAYLDTALMRYVIAEVYRYVVSLTKAKDVTAVHAVRDGALVVVVRWAPT